MASVLEQLIIELKADDSKLRSELTKIVTEARRAGDETGRAFAPGQTALKRLSDEVRAGIRPLREYRDALKQQEQELRATANAQDRNSKEYRATVSELASVRTELVSVNRELQNQVTALDRVGQSMQRAGGMLSLTVTAPLVAMGAQITRVSADFEASMNRVRALSGATGTDFDKLRNQARDLGATTVFSASEAADAMGFLAMAGFEVEQIYASMPATLSLAAAAQLDMATSADIVSNILTGFNMPVNQLTGAVDVLTKAFTSANTDLGQLGDGMTYVGPIASGLGVSFEETTAALGALSNAGIQGSMAGTSLRRILSTLASDSDKLGVSAYDAAGNMRPLADIIDELNKRGMTTAETLEVFGDRGGPAMSALLAQGGQALRTFTADLENAGGTADEIAKVQMEGLAGQIKELESVLEELMLSLGDAGLLRFLGNAARSLRDAIRSFNELGESTKTTILIIGGIAAGVGPALLILGRLATAVRQVQTAFVALRAVVLAMSGPAGWITLGVVAIGALVVRLSGGRDSLDSVAERAGAALEGMASDAGVAQEAFEKLTEATDENGLKAAVEGLAGTLEGEAKDAFVTLANQAIASGGDIEDVAADIMRVFAEMRAESLATRVATTRDLAMTAQAAYEQAQARHAQSASDVAGLEVPETAARDMQSLRQQIAGLENVREYLNDTQLEHLASLESQLARLEDQYGRAIALENQHTEELQAAFDARQAAARAHSEALADEALNTAYLAGRAASPIREREATVIFGPDADTDGDTPPGRDTPPGVETVLKAAEEATIRTAATAEELFKALEREGAAVVSQVAQLGGTVDLEMQGVEMRIGLVRAALERAWDLEDMTAEQFAFLETRLAELEAELEGTAQRFARVVTQPQPDEGSAVYPRDSWRHWSNNRTDDPASLARAVRAAHLRPEEGIFSPAPEFGRFEFQSLQAMQPLLDDFERGWERVVNRAHYLGEEVDFTNERLQLLSNLITGAAEMGIPREHLSQWIDEYDVIKAGEEAGAKWANAAGRAIVNGLSSIQAFTQAVGAGELTLLPEKDLSVKPGSNDIAFLSELADAAQRLMNVNQDPLEELRSKLVELAESESHAAEQAQILIDQLDAFKEASEAAEAQADRVKRFEAAVDQANSVLGVTQDRTSLAIDHLEALAAELDDGTRGGWAMAEALRELIEKLRELQEEVTEAETDLSKLAGNLQAVDSIATGLASSFTRAAANVAEGLKLITEVSDELTPEQATEQKMRGLATIITGITAAVEGLKQAASRGMSGNDIISLIGGIGSVTAEVIGTLTGIPGLGQVAGAAFGLLNSVIGDLSDGLAEVDAQVQDLTRSSSYMGDQLTRTFQERFTRQVSRGGIAGSFGATKAELDAEAFTAAMTLAESFGSMLEQALRSGDFETGWNDAILDAMIQAFTMSTEIQNLILDMVDFWNEAWADGTWSAAEDAEWRRLQEDYRRRGERERQRYIDAGLITEEEERNERRRRTGGNRITDLTGPARDHFSDLLAPLANLGAQLATLQDIRNILDSRLRPGVTNAAGGGQVFTGPIHITSTATNASDLLRDLGRALNRKARGV